MRRESDAAGMMTEQTIGLVSFVLTLMVFSYVLGDLPLIGVLYRTAIYLFVGMTAAFTLVVSYEGLILPYLQDIQNAETSWTTLGYQADIYIFFTALLFGLLLLLKPIRALTWLTNCALCRGDCRWCIGGADWRLDRHAFSAAARDGDHPGESDR